MPHILTIFECVYTTKRETTRTVAFPTKDAAISYAMQLARHCVDNATQLHAYINTDAWFQVDVDRTAAGWVAFQSDLSGIHRLV